MPARIPLTDQAIAAALEASGGVIYLAAQQLGVSSKTLARRLKACPDLRPGAPVDPVWEAALERTERIFATTNDVVIDKAISAFLESRPDLEAPLTPAEDATLSTLISQKAFARYQTALGADEIEHPEESPIRLLSPQETSHLWTYILSTEVMKVRVHPRVRNRKAKEN
jgi:hypothetical protein